MEALLKLREAPNEEARSIHYAESATILWPKSYKAGQSFSYTIAWQFCVQCGTLRLEFGLTRDRNKHLHHPEGQALPHLGSSIDQRLSADTVGAPTNLQEDSHSQAILKLRPPNSFDYRVCYEPQPKLELEC